MASLEQSDNPSSSSSESLSCRGVDHVSFSVPDLNLAVAFFVNTLGATELYRKEFKPPPGSNKMMTQFNAHQDASYEISKLDLCGMPIELFQYTSPDLNKEMPRNCDPGGSHIGILVDDIESAVTILRMVPGVEVLGNIEIITGNHPLAGRKWIYFITPWGLQLELVTPL